MLGGSRDPRDGRSSKTCAYKLLQIRNGWLKTEAIQLTNEFCHSAATEDECKVSQIVYICNSIVVQVYPEQLKFKV